MNNFFMIGNCFIVSTNHLLIVIVEFWVGLFHELVVHSVCSLDFRDLGQLCEPSGNVGELGVIVVEELECGELCVSAKD
jgi:hypothetical protein